MATIYDIAKLSQTSVATVSYVLNGHGDERRISKATQERVLAAAERINYRPNITARQLKSTVNPDIRIAAFWPGFYFEQSLVSAMRAVNAVSRASTENIEVSVHFFTPGLLNEYWENFSPLNYNGILLAGASLDDLEFISSRHSPVPLVLTNRNHEFFPYVTINHTSAGRMACDLAYENGGSSICTVWDTRFHVATNLRRTAFMERCSELGIDLNSTSFSCEGSSQDGYKLGMSLVQKKQLERVLYCNNESVARGLITAFNESGIRVGKDLLLLSANNGPDSFFRYITPSVTAIDLRLQEVFELALKKLLSIIVHNESAENGTTIQPRIVYRETLPEKGNS